MNKVAHKKKGEKGMSFKFSLSKKEDTNVNVLEAFAMEDEKEEEERNFVSKLDTRKGFEKPKEKEYVIPLPPKVAEARKMAEMANPDPPREQVTYQEEELAMGFKMAPGLHIMGPKIERKVSEKELPLTLLGRIEGMEGHAEEEEKYRHDVSQRPENSQSQYDEIPVEEFGKALLKGMGWKEGEGVGRSNKKDVKPPEFVRRVGRTGLGAAPVLPEEKKKRVVLPGDEVKDPTLVARRGADGKVRHRVEVGEKLVKATPDGLHVGCEVRVVGGVHEGLTGRVKHISGSVVRLMLDRSKQMATVDVSELQLYVRAAEKRKAEESKEDGQKKHKNESNQMKEVKIESDEKKEKIKKETKEEKMERKEKKEEEFWLTTNIVVRIVDKKFRGGKHYNEKVSVMDVYKKGECQILLNDGNLVDGVKQKYLETVVPQVGGKVLVLRGKRKGLKGTVLEKNTKKSKATVEITECGSKKEKSFSYDDIAEYRQL